MSVPPTDREGDSTAVGQSHIFALLRFRDAAGRWLDKNILHDTTLIGSAKGCDLRLKSESIAPVHCLITLDRWRLTVRDLSAGGTKRNGAPVSHAALSDGDRLSLGVHDFEIRTNLSGCAFHGFYLDHYEVTEILGSGGMCWIYGGRNSLTHEPVALKVLPSNYTPRTLAHFSLEARVGQRLGEHPRVIRMSRIVRTEPVYCIVMEYLEGISLQELVERDGPLPAAQACHFIRQAAEALGHVHRCRIVHRDVKPNNLIVCRDGGLKLIDFNLALTLDDDQPDRLLQHYRKHVVGTADYISPEQSVRSDKVDPRSDLYSLGCIFYFLLTGDAPFPGDGVPEKLQAHRTETPRDVRERTPSVPDDVAQIVHRLLKKSPEQRFQTADELIAALEPHARAEPIRFDWSAVLSARAATARRRLEKLLARQSARRREAAHDSSAAIADPLTDTPGGNSTRRSSSGTQPIELELFTTLDEGSPQQTAERQALNELFLMWPQLSPTARDRLVELARRLEGATPAAQAR
jgi:serine/threonine-protein kinase